MFFEEESERWRKCGEVLKDVQTPEEIKMQESERLLKEKEKEK